MSRTADEDTAVIGNVLADNGSGIDSDSDGDPLTVSAVNGVAADIGSQVTLASGALLTLNADGTFAYDPNGQFEILGDGENVGDSFTYTISDGQDSDSAVVAITIDGVNDAPLAADDAFATGADAVLGGNVLANNGNGPDSEMEGDVLTVVAVNGTTTSVGQQVALASGALLTLNANGTFSYDPNGQFESLGVGESAQETFTYTISDGQGGTAIATATITINGVNDGPAAADDAFATGENAVLNRTVLGDNGSGADSDPEGDPLAVSAVNGVAADAGSQVTLASGALLTLNADGTLSFDPNGQFESLGEGGSTQDSFTYTISDGNGGSDTATVAITISGVNDAPEVTSDTAVVVKGAVLAITPAILSASDPETGDPSLITGEVPSPVRPLDFRPEFVKLQDYGGGHLAAE